MRLRRFTLVATVMVAVFGVAGVTSAADGWTDPVAIWGEPMPRHAVAFDRDGGIHVATEGAHHGGGLWYVTATSEEKVIKGVRSEFEPSIAVSGTDGGRVRIAWVDRDDRSAVWLTRNDTGSWVSSRMWLGRAFNPSIANLGDGVAMVFRDGRHRLRYLVWDPVTGPTQPEVVATGCCRGKATLVVRSAVPWVAYAKLDPDPMLNLARRTADGWRASTVLDGATSAPSLAFRRGAANVAYWGPGGRVWWAERTDEGWRRSRVRGVGASGPPSIAARAGRVFVVGADGGAVTVRRVDGVYQPVVLARPDELDTDGVWDARIAIADGRPTVTFTTQCACAGGGGGIWVTER